MKVKVIGLICTFVEPRIARSKKQTVTPRDQARRLQMLHLPNSKPNTNMQDAPAAKIGYIDSMCMALKCTMKEASSGEIETAQDISPSNRVNVHTESFPI